MDPLEDDKIQFLQRSKCTNPPGVSTLESTNLIYESVPIDDKSADIRQTQMKWRNAFSYVYQVRRKLSSQPQIYNEFIDIMRRVHTRCVETTEVVSIISNIFKEHPDLIRGFNMFLPDKHKIETEIKLHVGVSGIPSPDSPSGDPNEREDLPITSRIIRFTLNVRKRFEDDEKRPDKYKRFVEVLYLYKALSQQLQGLRKCRKKLKEEDVYAEVRKLFENNDDLLREFSEYLPYNRKLSEIYRNSYRYEGDENAVECSCCSEVSSSGQVDAKKGINDENLYINDEVTSSDGSVLDRASESVSERKFDVTSSHLNLKMEPMEEDNVYCDESNSRDVVEDNFFMESSDQTKEEVNIEGETEYDAFNLEHYEVQTEKCRNEMDTKEIVIDEKYILSKNEVSQENIPINDDIIIKKENLNQIYDENYYPDDGDQKVLGNVSPRSRSSRKPLTPFKVPTLPSNSKSTQEVKQSTKRSQNDRVESSTASTKKQALRQAISRSPSPPDFDTPVITRLAKRAAQGSPDKESSGASPRRQTSTSSASPVPRSSDRRLKNLKKRLRRLANM